MKQETLQLQKIKIEIFPLVEAVVELLGLRPLLVSALGHARHAEAALALVKNVLSARSALYRVKNWAGDIDPTLMGKIEINDDVLGRSLDKLFAADRASLQSKITMAAVKEFSVDVSTIHNDSTSVSVFGKYPNQDKKAVKLKRGHSKDHRPDLKQLIFSLSVTADGALPIHFKSYDGNITDDTTHQESWTTLRGILAKSDFLYVADSKLCTEENMRYIDSNQGSFITIVPRTRAETQEFSNNAYSGEVRWEELLKNRNSRKKNEVDRYEIAENFSQLREGYRLFWYRSSQKIKRDEEARRSLIDAAWEKLEQLQNQKRRGPKTKNALEKNAASIITKYKATDWINIEIRSVDEVEFKKTTRGKPGSDATFTRVIKKQYQLIIKKNPEGIARSQVMDGVFPLATNTKLSALEVLKHYKYQPHLEKRFSLFKSVCEVAPVYLKNNKRIEALMFIYFIAMLIAALIERRIRKEMEASGVKTIKSLPEDRHSPTPTWEQLVRLFDGYSRYDLLDDKKLVKTFSDKTSDVQKQILGLLKFRGVSKFY